MPTSSRRPRLGLLAAGISAVAGAGIGAALGWDWLLCLLLPLVPVGTLLGIVDHRTRLLPLVSWCCPATLAALAYGGLRWAATGDADELVRGVVCLLLVRTVFWLLWFVRQAGMGFGDVRLSALLGCTLGTPAPSPSSSASTPRSCSSRPGLLIAVVKRDRSVLKRATRWPFLLFGAWLGIVAGEPLVAAIWG